MTGTSPQAVSVGRVVHYHFGGHPKGQPWPAIVTHRWSDTMVNLAVQNDGLYWLEENLLNPTEVQLCDPAKLERGQIGWSWPPR